MSFANLIKNAPSSGSRIKLKGGQSQGNIEKTTEKISIEKYVPSLGKGSEYAAKFRAEEDKAYLESMAAMSVEPGRVDVTSGEGLSQLYQPEELTSIGTLPNLQELNREELIQVYNQYNFTPLEPSEHLEPIHNQREQILRLIESNQVCIIKGPTGCGKSTQIPQFILDSYAERRAHCNIVVTQPRRIAAITIAQHVCEMRKWDVGTLVGYQVGLDKQAGENTRLLYCTTGVLLEKLITTKHLNDYTHILLDEVHEREEDMDFVMLVVKRFLRSNSRNVRVVLMSATMDVTRFAKYFEVRLRNETQPAPYYELKRDTKFTVQVHYLDALKQLGNLPEITVEDPNITKEAYQLVPTMIRAFNLIDLEDYKHKRCTEERGAVLVFLPGLYQIETLFQVLITEDKRDPEAFNFWLCPLHSSITKDEQEKVRMFAPHGKRKIILSTNIAESSITIPDVKYVIDFCLTKHLVADPVTGFTSLQLAWASHTNCIQREGRVGRVQDGRVYRLVPREFYQLSMSVECVPEMQRCPLDLIVLKCKKLLEEECPLRLISSALDPPDLDNYEKTILKLKEIGALLVTCREELNPLDGDLTFVGRVMSSLPLDIHITKLILLGHVFDVLEETIIMGCAMAVRNIFSEPFLRRLDAYNNKLMWADSSESDSIAYLNAYVVWRQLTGIGKFMREIDSESAWARRHLLQTKHLHEVAKQEADIKKRLSHFNIKPLRQRGQPLWNAMEKPLILKLVLAGAFYPHYYSRSAQNPNAESEAVKMLAGYSPYSCVYLQNMPHPVPLYVDQLRDCLRKNGVADDVEIHYNDSRKVVVAFNHNKNSVEQKMGDLKLHLNIPGEIVMPVYRAVKLRQLNIPITIKTLRPSEVKEELSKLGSERSAQFSDKSAAKSQISLQTQHLEIEVSHVENAGHFYGHIVQPSTEENLRQIHHLLNSGAPMRPVFGNIMEDKLYAAPYKDEDSEDSQYYRAKITKKYRLQNVDRVIVFFIDYGNMTSLPVCELRVICKETQSDLCDIPPCALECVLAEVGPSLWANQGGQWSDQATDYVKYHILNKTCYLQIYSFVCGVASVRLFTRDNWKPSQHLPLTLNQDLINRGYARHKEESYFSKLNHAKRKELEERGEGVPLVPSVNSEGRVTNSLLGMNLMTLPTTHSPAGISLKGPVSPLEMKLFSMVHCSSQREVKVEWNSVNSVLLDSDPSDPHERLVVAGSVSQSPDGRKLTVNHTTVLPNMHGLAALVSLIFSPSIELRTDDMFSRYTGALCGLGKNELGTSLFPENDMEIIFDVEFTNDDLLIVNKLRYWMNERFCNDDAEDMPDAEITTIQTNIRSLIISLLKPVRRSVKVYRNPRPFTWNIIPSRRLFHPFPDTDASEFSNFIYQLHRGIDISAENDRLYIEQLTQKMKNLNESFACGLAPRQLVCELCDVNYDYINDLKLHLTSRHHRDLVQWLRRRMTAHTPDKSA